MELKEYIEYLQTLDPKIKVLRHDGQGYNLLQHYQLPKIDKRKYERCYYRSDSEGEEYLLLS